MIAPGLTADQFGAVVSHALRAVLMTSVYERLQKRRPHMIKKEQMDGGGVGVTVVVKSKGDENALSRAFLKAVQPVVNTSVSVNSFGPIDVPKHMVGQVLSAIAAVPYRDANGERHLMELDRIRDPKDNGVLYDSEAQYGRTGPDVN